MSKSKQPLYELPPRRWYNLEQACKRIKQLTGEEIGIDDLFHFWITNKLEISVFITCGINYLFLSDYKFDNFRLIEQPRYKIDKQHGLIIEEQKTENEIIIDDVFSKEKTVSDEKTFFIYSGFFSVFCHLGSDGKEEKRIINNGLPISFICQLFTPYSEEYQGRIGFHLTVGEFEELEEIDKTYLKPDELYILSDSLARFLAQNNEELKLLKNAIKNKPHRLPNSLNDEVLRLARLNFERYYPTASANNLAKAINKHLIEVAGHKPNEVNKPDTIGRALRKHGIGSTDPDTTLEISKIYTE